MAAANGGPRPALRRLAMDHHELYGVAAPVIVGLQAVGDADATGWSNAFPGAEVDGVEAPARMAQFKFQMALADNA